MPERKTVKFTDCEYEKLDAEQMALLDKSILKAMYDDMEKIERRLDIETISARNYKEEIHRAMVEAERRDHEHEFTPEWEPRRTCKNWFEGRPSTGSLMGQRHYTGGF